MAAFPAVCVTRVVQLVPYRVGRVLTESGPMTGIRFVALRLEYKVSSRVEGGQTSDHHTVFPNLSQQCRLIMYKKRSATILLIFGFWTLLSEQPRETKREVSILTAIEVYPKWGCVRCRWLQPATRLLNSTGLKVDAMLASFLTSY